MSQARFVIEDLVEVHRDPGGHYHHFSVLIGQLQQGSLSFGQILSFDTELGGVVSAKVGGFEAFRKFLPQTIHAEDQHGTLGVMLWGPAPPKAWKARGEASVVSLEEHEQHLQRLLTQHPAIFFHHQGQTPFFCPECFRALWRLEGAKTLLAEGLERWTDPVIYNQAQGLLAQMTKAKEEKGM
ncbi:MAG: hypothetical protein H6728_15730 [Myxococcales bacterium]|nr:hypothetical protein [Myxococcales bacterium]MCB9644523.1 hypothetical protein [Myxococcales bacterium]